MAIFELISVILKDMYSCKLRSFLSLLGIMWGTIAVVLLLALGDGFYQASRSQLSLLVNGAIMGMPGSTSLSYHGLPKGRQVMFKADQLMRLPKVIPEVDQVSPVLGGWNKTARFLHQANSGVGQIYGVSNIYASLVALPVLPGGRFLNKRDLNNKRQVIVLSSSVAQALFPYLDPVSIVGKKVFFQGIPFLVVGIQQPDQPNPWSNRISYVPYTTYIDLYGDENIYMFIIMPKDPSGANSLELSISRYFSRIFHYDMADKQAVRFFGMRKTFDFFQWFFSSIKMFLGFCGLLTLAVGGISVANMMFLVVTERTREIGLRLALGARDTQIMGQILLETFVIVAMGGGLGFLFSGMFLAALRHLNLPQWLGVPSLSWPVLFGTVFVLSIVALLSGYFPAKRAAALDPVEALEF